MFIQALLLLGYLFILEFIGCGVAFALVQPDLILVAPQVEGNRPLRAGKSVRFVVVLTNGGRDTQPVPPVLALTLVRTSGEKIEVNARPVNGGIAPVVPGNGFLKQRYEFILPAHMMGLLSMSAQKSNTAMFYVKSPVEDGQLASGMDEGNDGNSIQDINRQFQPFFGNFSAYKPVYFLFGIDPGLQSSSFQISFQYKLFNFEKRSFGSQYLSGLKNIRLAYTQNSFWDLKSDSAPFEDSRYMPELFYTGSLNLDLPCLVKSGFHTGLQHESNGRSGDESRSTNYGYIQPFFVFKFLDSLYWKLAPKAWVYIKNEDETNGDLADYRGYFDLENKMGDPLGLVFENHFRHGKKGSSWQFDFSYPLNRIPWLKGFLDMYIHAQYFTGYSDQLLKYNQREDVIRLGFSLVR